MDDLREFEEALSQIEELKENESENHGFQSAARIIAYSAVITKVRIAMSDWRKRHTEQNSDLSVEVFEGELCPLLQKQQSIKE